MPTNSENNYSLRPLQTDRQRTSEVEEQVRWLLSETPTERLRLISLRSGNGEYLIKEETLVYLVRNYQAENANDMVAKLVQALIDRTNSFLMRTVHRMLGGYSQVHIEQCQEEIQSDMIVAVLDASPRHEFWEVAFWCCLKRRALNCIEKSRRVAQNELNPTILTDDSGGETNTLDLMVNPNSDIAHRQLEARQALESLNPKQRQAAYLHYVEGWSQQEVANHFGVTDKTIRNWLTGARKSLEAYYKPTN